MGGIVNALRWVEMLAAGLFTFEATRSGVDVAAVLAVRSLPLLVLGPLAGLVCDAWDRKRVLFWGLSLNAAAAAAISLLGLLGTARPWQIGIAAFLSGMVWATEMAGRRRMIGECAGDGLVSRAIAVDSLTNSLARIIGPLLGSLAYALVGLGGAFAISAATYLAGALLVSGVAHRQQTSKLQLARLPSELNQALIYALGNRMVLGVVLATAAMNLFAFSYTAIVPLLARLGFGVGDALAGVLATGEPAGAFLGGLILARWTPPFDPLAMLLGGGAIFMLGLCLMAIMPEYGLACLALVLGGLGLSLFNNMQTTLVLTEAPPRHPVAADGADHGWDGGRAAWANPDRGARRCVRTVAGGDGLRAERSRGAGRNRALDHPRQPSTRRWRSVKPCRSASSSPTRRRWQMQGSASKHSRQEGRARARPAACSSATPASSVDRLASTIGQKRSHWRRRFASRPSGGVPSGRRWT